MDTFVDIEDGNALAEDAVPIREISRITGVNTVTLRAWERRYGLLIPQRTSKGHRLYSRADIDRVKEIQLWLGRGLAISKVKALLADEQGEEGIRDIESIWMQLAQQMQMAINAFNRNQLERLIEDTFALYPVPMIADYLLEPLMVALQGDEPGKLVRRAFFSAVFLEYIQAAKNRQRQSAQGEKILLLSVAQNECSVLSQVLHFGLLVNQHQAESLGYLTAKESLLGVEALGAQMIVLIGDDSVNSNELQLHLNLWRDRSDVSVVLAGSVVRLVRALTPDLSPNVVVCENQQQVLATIHQLLTR